MSFTLLEHQVIAIGLLSKEPAANLHDRGGGAVAFLRTALSGGHRRTPLADRRLEALRALTAAIRDQSKRIDPVILDTFIIRGGSVREVEALRRMVADRSPRHHITAAIDQRGMLSDILRQAAASAVGFLHSSFAVASCSPRRA